MDDGRYTVRVLWGCISVIALPPHTLFFLRVRVRSSSFGAALLEHLIAFVLIVILAMRNIPSRLSARVRFASVIDKRLVHVMHLACDPRRVRYAIPDMVHDLFSPEACAMSTS